MKIFTDESKRSAQKLNHSVLTAEGQRLAYILAASASTKDFGPTYGFTQSALYNWISGKSYPNVGSINLLESALVSSGLMIQTPEPRGIRVPTDRLADLVEDLRVVLKERGIPSITVTMTGFTPCRPQELQDDEPLAKQHPCI